MHKPTCLTLMLVGLGAATALAGGHGRRIPSYSSDYTCTPPATGCSHGHDDGCGHTQSANAHASTGYWTTRNHRVWVPGRWVATTSPYTGAYSFWQSAHYETRCERVWVSTARPLPTQYCQR